MQAEDEGFSIPFLSAKVKHYVYSAAHIVLNPNREANLLKLAQRSLEQEAELLRIEKEAIANFAGDLPDLEAALGMLRMGDHMGWRVLVLIHNKRTIRKYEDILGIKVREFFPEVGPSASRSVGFKLATAVGNFWKAVSGDIKIERRQEISTGPE